MSGALVNLDVASMAQLLRETERRTRRTKRVLRSTIGLSGMPPTSSRVKAGSLRRRGSRRDASCRSQRRTRTEIGPLCEQTSSRARSSPDYELPDHTNTKRRLSELQGEDRMILTLARGHYCPKEHQQHLELAAFYPKIAVAYTQVATIATDDHHALRSSARP